MARKLAGKHNVEIINPWVRSLINKIDNLKFLCHIDQDGYPIILPVIQTQVLGNDKVIFSMAAYGDELRRMQTNTKMAIFALSFSMEDVLLRYLYWNPKDWGCIMWSSRC